MTAKTQDRSPLASVTERLFGLRAHRTTVWIEARAALATFLTTAYILAVNPQILSQAGMPVHDLVAATAIASAFGCLAMGLLANYPFALAPGMGMNAYFTFGVVVALGVSWQTALGAVLVEGVLFVVLSLTGLRTLLVEAIPHSIQLAIAVGIGLLLAFVGLRSAGLVSGDPATLVGLGSWSDPEPRLALIGLIAIGTLQALRVPGALLVGIVGVAVLAWLSGTAEAPAAWISTPHLPSETFLAFDLRTVFSARIVPVVAALLMVDIFDTAGTLLGVGRVGGFIGRDGKLPRANRAFLADALATVAGAVVGTSTVTSYVESAAGVEEGGKTGLVAVFLAVLFLLSLAFVPVLVAIPPAATAPALIVVGALMTRPVAEIAWSDPSEALPAFLTIVFMPLTSSIANGIAAGLVCWVLLRTLTGRWREVSWVAWLMAAVLAFFLLELRA